MTRSANSTHDQFLLAHRTTMVGAPAEYDSTALPQIPCLDDAVLAELLADSPAAANQEPPDSADIAAVHHHLGHCETCQSRLEQLAGAGWSDWEELLEDSRIDWPGRQPDSASTANNLPAVPGYELYELIGRGGMGVVFRARHKALNRLVALKTVKDAELADGESLSRLRREAELLAQLQHPNVVQIHEILEHAGRRFLALELVEGGTLADRLRTSPLAPHDAAELVRVLADTMQSAHDAGILHRDLKPANVLLTRQGVPKISDFGLARGDELAPGGETRTGRIIGTPCYVAPEQARGARGWSTPAVDIYALGVVLYECLTGGPPFRADNALETLRLVVSEDPVSPSHLQPRIPRDLVTICLRCLEKEPSRRYATAADLAEDLRRFIEGESILARRDWFWTVAAKRIRRHPITTALSVAVTIAVAALLVIWGVYTYRLEAINSQLRLETRRATASQRRSEQHGERAEFAKRRALVATMQMTTGLRSNLQNLLAASTAGGGGLTDEQCAFGRKMIRSFATVNASCNYDELRLEQAKNYHWLSGVAMKYKMRSEALYYSQRAANLYEGATRMRGRDPEKSRDFGVILAQLAVCYRANGNPKRGAEAETRARAVLNR